jgi:hypothetical protein
VEEEGAHVAACWSAMGMHVAQGNDACRAGHPLQALFVKTSKNHGLMFNGEA